MRQNAPAALCVLAAVVPFQTPAQAGNGCADGTYSRVTSPDGNATSLLFDDFSATSGNGAGTSRSRTTCAFDVPVTKPGGYSVFSVDYRGFVTTESGQSAEIVTLKDGTKVFQHRVAGQADGDLTLGHKVGVSSEDSLGLTVQIGTDAPLVPGDPDAYLFLDTIDVTRIGFTTRQSVQQSVDDLARDRQFLAGAFQATAQDLLGGKDRFDEGTSLGFFGNSETAAGFAGRWEAGDGMSFLGGAAILQPNGADLDVDPLPLFAGAVRYTTPPSTWRAFGEAGAYGAPRVRTELTRSYLNGNDVVNATGSASGSSFGLYGRLGAVFAPTDGDEFSISAQAGRSWLNLGGYDESRSDRNLFGATINGGTSAENTVSATLAWSHRADDRTDYTLTAEAGRVFADDDAVTATVDWVGAVAGTAKDRNFFNAGGRLGLKLDDAWKLDVTLNAGTLQSDKVKVTAGARLKVSF